MKYDAIVLMIISSLFTILGIIIGGYLSHKSAKDLFTFQQNRELKIRTYSLLMGVKLPLTQTIRTTLEAKMLCEYYDARFKYISKNTADLEEAKRQNERMLSLMSQVASLKRELFEGLGNVMISYEFDKEMSALIDALYKHKGAEISELKDGEINSSVDLDSWKNKTNAQIQDYINVEFLNRFEILLPIMRSQLKDELSE